MSVAPHKIITPIPSRRPLSDTEKSVLEALGSLPGSTPAQLVPYVEVGIGGVHRALGKLIGRKKVSVVREPMAGTRIYYVKGDEDKDQHYSAEKGPGRVDLKKQIIDVLREANQPLFASQIVFRTNAPTSQVRYALKTMRGDRQIKTIPSKRTRHGIPISQFTLPSFSG